MIRNQQLISPYVMLLTWIVAVPLFAILSSAVVLKNGPQVMWTSGAGYMYPVNSGEFELVMLEARGDRQGVWSQAFVRIWGHDDEAYAEVDLQKMQVVTASPANFGASYQTPPPAYPSPRPLTDAEVLSWFGYAGADTTKQPMIDEATELASIIATIPGHGMTSIPTSHLTYVERASPIYGPAGWLVLAVIGFWLIVWGVGFVIHFVLWLRSGKAEPAA